MLRFCLPFRRAAQSPTRFVLNTMYQAHLILLVDHVNGTMEQGILTAVFIQWILILSTYSLPCDFDQPLKGVNLLFYKILIQTVQP